MALKTLVESDPSTAEKSVNACTCTCLWALNTKHLTNIDYLPGVRLTRGSDIVGSK